MNLVSDPHTTGVGVAFTSISHDYGDRQGLPARDQALTALGQTLGVHIAVVSQEHGRHVITLTDDALDPTRVVVEMAGRFADGLVTAVPGLALGIRVADCVPVMFADPVSRVVGAAHAGREGVRQQVLAATVAAMREAGSTGPIRAWVGPHICASCYEVPEEMATAFAEETGVAMVTTRWNSCGIDLGAAVARQLDDVGVSFVAQGECTLTSTELHSHRRDGVAAGRQLGLVWLS